MSRALNWDREGKIWPNRDASEFIAVGKARWHVQRMGQGKRVLLLHGTGASCHSWRDVMPFLAREFEVIAPDLPRHAFTQGHPPESTSLPGMAREIARLLDTMDVQPDMIVGHSAGAALALQMSLDHGYSGPIVGLNAALKPFPGPAAQLFPAMAKLLFVNPLVPRIFSGAASFGEEGERFIYRSTNSHVDAAGLACYKALLTNSKHTGGALAMMANWDLPRLSEQLRTIENPVLLVHSTGDNAIPLEGVRNACAKLPNASLEVLQRLGHLAHEEQPDKAAELISQFAQAPIRAD